MIPDSITIALRPWAEQDFPLMERTLGDPAMTVHLGGPETPEKLKARHERYTRFSETGPGCMYVVVIGSQQEPAGSVGYWEKEWRGETVWECGWNVLPEFQGQGIATRATAELIKFVRAEQTHRYLHAFPSINNDPSNAICSKLGFTLLAEYEFEYPPGNYMRCDDWRFDLFS
jgi:RimJ/RimL family protein N-acetyltransferase